MAASLIEAVTHLRSGGPEAIQHAQTALAAARTYQLDQDSSIRQFGALAQFLDVACSLRQGNPAQMATTLRSLRLYMDESLKDHSWSESSDVVAVPMNFLRQNAQVVTQDTRMILESRADGRYNLFMSFLNKRDAYALTLVPVVNLNFISLI